MEGASVSRSVYGAIPPEGEEYWRSCSAATPVSVTYRAKRRRGVLQRRNGCRADHAQNSPATNVPSALVTRQEPGGMPPTSVRQRLPRHPTTPGTIPAAARVFAIRVMSAFAFGLYATRNAAMPARAVTQARCTETNIHTENAPFLTLRRCFLPFLSQVR